LSCSVILSHVNVGVSYIFSSSSYHIHVSSAPDARFIQVIYDSCLGRAPLGVHTHVSQADDQSVVLCQTKGRQQWMLRCFRFALV